MRQQPRELMKDRTLQFLLTIQFEAVVILQVLGLRFKSIDTERNQFRASLVVGIWLAANCV